MEKAHTIESELILLNDFSCRETRLHNADWLNRMIALGSIRRCTVYFIAGKDFGIRNATLWLMNKATRTIYISETIVGMGSFISYQRSD